MLGLQVIACTAKCFDLRNILFSGYSPGSAEPGGADMWDGPGDEKGDAGGRSALLLCSREARSTRGEHSASVESGATVDVLLSKWNIIFWFFSQQIDIFMKWNKHVDTLVILFFTLVSMLFFFFFQIENKELRDLLVISKSSVKTAREETSQPEAEVAATAAQDQSPQSGSTEWSEQLQSELWLRQQVLQDQGWRRQGWWSLCLCAPHYFFI